MRVAIACLFVAILGLGWWVLQLTQLAQNQKATLNALQSRR